MSTVGHSMLLAKDVETRTVWHVQPLSLRQVIDVLRAVYPYAVVPDTAQRRGSLTLDTTRNVVVVHPDDWGSTHG